LPIHFLTILTRCVRCAGGGCGRDAVVAERDKLVEINDRLRRLLRKAQGFEAKRSGWRNCRRSAAVGAGDIEQAIAGMRPSKRRRLPPVTIAGRSIAGAAGPSAAHP